MSWEAWRLDAPTWAFLFWLVWFLGWETIALVSNNYLDTWTAHFRPFFTEASFTWFLGQGFLFWFWIHVFYPKLERWIIEVIK